MESRTGVAKPANADMRYRDQCQRGCPSQAEDGGGHPPHIRSARRGLREQCVGPLDQQPQAEEPSLRQRDADNGCQQAVEWKRPAVANCRQEGSQQHDGLGEDCKLEPKPAENSLHERFPHCGPRH